MVVKQFEIWLVSLDPTKGSEIKKTRPCMIVSPNEMNHYLNTVIIVPLTSTIRNYPTRIKCLFENKEGQFAIDQLRAADKSRLIKKIGLIKDKPMQENVLNVLQDIFSM